MRARIVLAMLVLAGASGLTRAQDKPLDRADLDKRIVLTVYESARLGTDLFNKGGHAECFRLYQGTVMAIQPLLDHRPKLQGSVKARLDKAAKMEPAKGAFELRAALDEIQNEIAPPKADPKDPKDPKATTALWERLGGEKGVRAVVKDFMVVAIEDPKVNFTRGGKVKIDPKGVAHLEQTLVELISQSTGGPLKYTGKDLKESHKGMMITDAEFDAAVAVFVAALKKNKVAEADIAELGKIVEGTRKDIVEKK